MEKFSWNEMLDYLREFNKKHNITSKGDSDHVCTVAAVVSEDSFTEKYSLEERTYIFTNHNKAVLPNMCSNSIFADSKDGSDRGVKLNEYVGSGKNDWHVEYCYIISEE